MIYSNACSFSLSTYLIVEYHPCCTRFLFVHWTYLDKSISTGSTIKCFFKSPPDLFQVVLNLKGWTTYYLCAHITYGCIYVTTKNSKVPIWNFYLKILWQTRRFDWNHRSGDRDSKRFEFVSKCLLPFFSKCALPSFSQNNLQFMTQYGGTNEFYDQFLKSPVIMTYPRYYVE
jgi:hypothetical protein